MKPNTGHRLYLLVYFVFGSAAGLYLIHLLISELGPAAVRDDVARTLPVALLVVVFFVVPLYAASQSWRMLFPPEQAPEFRSSAMLTWIGLSVNWLLPAALVGGELIKFRLAYRRACGVENLAASLVGDKTIQVFTQLIYTILGVSVLAWTGSGVKGGVGELAGLALFCIAVFLFYRLQRAGMFAGAAKRMKAFVRDRECIEIKAARFDAAIDRMYRRSGRWWTAVSWRVLFRLLMAVEVVLVFWWLGQPVDLWAAVALESITQAARVAAIVVPAALGAQEAVIAAVGLSLGYPPDALFALAAAKRIRELAVGGTGIGIWQFLEARRLMRNST